jgi:hypothetical protein
MPQLPGAFLSTTVAANPGVSDQTNLKQGETNAGSRLKTLIFGNSAPRNKRMHRSGTRIPCQIPAKLISLDPTRPFADSCLVILVNLRGVLPTFAARLKSEPPSAGILLSNDSQCSMNGTLLQLSEFFGGLMVGRKTSKSPIQFAQAE